ncbi:prepilin peptidase [Bacteroidota bacterium]
MIELILILTGLTMGSFANNMISYFTGSSRFDLLRSTCLCGEKVLAWNEIIPVVSYIFLKGKCGSCEKRIPARYIIVESVSALLILLCYFRYGLTVEALFHYSVLWLLLVIGLTDLDKMIIPNTVTFFLITAALAGFHFLETEILTKVITSIAFIAVFSLLNFMYERIKKRPALGYGDIKLIGALALFYPLFQFSFGIWLASLLAIPGYFYMKKPGVQNFREGKIPFGFFLCTGFIISDFFAEVIEMSYYDFIIN